MEPPKQSWTAALFGLVPIASGCLVDLGAACGDDLRQADDGTCVCPAGSVLSDGECVRCGTHEVARGNQCVCAVGYSRGADERCGEEPAAGATPAGPSSSCDGGCPGTEPPVAQACQASTDCGELELCDVHESERCVAQPAGLGEPCGSDADCTGTEAEYCEIFSSRSCQIDGCAEAQGVCPGDMACCDFSVIGRSMCVPAANLEEGACPAPGVLIERGESP